MTADSIPLKVGDAVNADRNNPFEALIKRLDLMIRAHYSLLYIVGAEEEPVEAVIAQVALQVTPARRLLFWDIVRGWEDNGSGKGSVMAALDRIGKTAVEEYTIFVLRDLHPVLKYPHAEKNVPVVRELRNLTRELKRSKKTIILTSHALELPEELQEEVTVINFPLPNVQEIEYLISHVVSKPEQLQVTGLVREQLVKAFQGLSRAKIGRILAKALAAKEQINESDIDEILEEKQQAIRQLPETIEAAQQKARKRGLEEGLEQGRQEQQRLILENFLQVRFGGLNPKMMAVLDPISKLSATDFTMLLLAISMLTVDDLGRELVVKLLAESVLKRNSTALGDLLPDRSD